MIVSRVYTLVRQPQEFSSIGGTLIEPFVFQLRQVNQFFVSTEVLLFEFGEAIDSHALDHQPVKVPDQEIRQVKCTQFRFVKLVVRIKAKHLNRTNEGEKDHAEEEKETTRRI